MPTVLPDVFDKAAELLAQDPLPDDAAKQLEALERRCPKQYRHMFADYWEALMVAGGPFVPPDGE